MASGLALSNLTLSETCNKLLLAASLVVRFRVNGHHYIRVKPDGTVDGKGLHFGKSHFRVSFGENQSILRFESVAFPGKFLRIKDDQVDCGSGGKFCHFKVIDISPGVVVLSRGDDGNIGVTETGDMKQPKATKQGKFAQLIVESAVDPTRIGMAKGQLVRLKHLGSNKFLRNCKNGQVDAIGGDGALPFYKCTDHDGKVSFQCVETSTYLSYDAHGKAATASTPHWFSVFFSLSDRTVSLVTSGAEAGKTAIPVMFSAEGQHLSAVDYVHTQAKPLGHFEIEAALDPTFFGLENQQKIRFRNEATGKFLRIKPAGEIDCEGGNGELTHFTMVYVPPCELRLQGVKTDGKCIRSLPDGSAVDGIGGPKGPNGLLQLVNLSEGKVAIRTPAGLLAASAPPKTATLKDGAIFTLMAV